MLVRRVPQVCWMVNRQLPVVVCVRNNSTTSSTQSTTTEAAPRPPHPLIVIAKDLRNKLDKNYDIHGAFNEFKEQVSNLSTRNDFKEMLERSNYLNHPILTMLQKSVNDKDASVDSYQILLELCQNGLARPNHFQTVFRKMLYDGEFKDVMALWVKYLEVLATNPYMKNGGYDMRAHFDNIAMGSIAYLALSDGAASYNTLLQILQQAQDEEHIFFIPLVDIQEYINQKQMEKYRIEFSLNESLNNLVFDISKNHSEVFAKKVEASSNFQLNTLYNLYKNLSKQKEFVASTKILTMFMDKFIESDRTLNAVKVFNQFKDKTDDELGLKNHLLIAVANTGANATAQNTIKSIKLERILAVWNSIIKSTGKPIEAKSFISLFKAFIMSENEEAVAKIFENEMPAELKSNQQIFELYLTSLLKRKEFTYQNLKNLIEEKSSPTGGIDQIASIELINGVLLKLLKESDNETDFNKFYDIYFNNVKKVNRIPNPETLALKMYSYYKFDHESSKAFQCLKSVAQNSKNVRRINSIIKNFITITPDIKIINQLYEQVREPLHAGKYSLFIQAQFNKGATSEYVKSAEKIFKDFLKNSDRKNNYYVIGKELVEPMLIGLCSSARVQRDASVISDINKYYEFSEKLKYTPSFHVLGEICRSISILARSTKFSPKNLEVAHSLMNKISSIKNFEIGDSYAKTMSTAGIKIKNSKK